MAGANGLMREAFVLAWTTAQGSYERSGMTRLASQSIAARASAQAGRRRQNRGRVPRARTAANAAFTSRRARLCGSGAWHAQRVTRRIAASALAQKGPARAITPLSARVYPCMLCLLECIHLMLKRLAAAGRGTGSLRPRCLFAAPTAVHVLPRSLQLHVHTRRLAFVRSVFVIGARWPEVSSEWAAVDLGHMVALRPIG